MLPSVKIARLYAYSSPETQGPKAAVCEVLKGTGPVVYVSQSEMQIEKFPSLNKTQYLQNPSTRCHPIAPHEKSPELSQSVNGPKVLELVRNN